MAEAPGLPGAVAAAIAAPSVLLILVLLSQRRHLDALREQVRASLDANRQELDRRLAETQQAVGEVRRGLGEVDRGVDAVGRIAGDLRALQELLRSPKLRGGLGETLLAELLAQVLPQSAFALQHGFPDGTRVDAVVRAGDRLVPVDSKFPLEGFHRLRAAEADPDAAAAPSARRGFRADVKRHVDAIAQRYIRPGDGTYDFALMYLPAEAIYRELLEDAAGDGDRDDLLHYALTRRVVPVSPQSFYAYLQVIVLGLQGLTVEERAREILDRIGDTVRRLARFVESFDTLARHLAYAHRQAHGARRRLDALRAALTGMTEMTGMTEVAVEGEASDRDAHQRNAPPT